MFDAVVLGATFTAAGFLSAFEGNCAVIEKNTLCGYEFINALKKGVEFKETPKTKNGVNFYEMLEKRDVFESDFNLFDAVVPLYRTFENKSIMLGTRVCEIEKKEDVFEITVFNNSGFEKIYTKKIIDTRCKKEDVISKTLNAIVKTELSLEESGISERKIYKCPLEIDDDFIVAREKLKKELEKGMIADYIAPEFDVVTRENILEKGEIIYIPSVSYKNPHLAFDAGCRLAEEGLR